MKGMIIRFAMIAAAVTVLVLGASPATALAYDGGPGVSMPSTAAG